MFLDVLFVILAWIIFLSVIVLDCWRPGLHPIHIPEYVYGLAFHRLYNAYNAMCVFVFCLHHKFFPTRLTDMPRYAHWRARSQLAQEQPRCCDTHKNCCGILIKGSIMIPLILFALFGALILSLRFADDLWYVPVALANPWHQQ